VLTDTTGIVSCYAKDRKSPHLPRQRALVRGENDPFITTSILGSRGESLQTATCILNFYLTDCYQVPPICHLFDTSTNIFLWKLHSCQYKIPPMQTYRTMRDFNAPQKFTHFMSSSSADLQSSYPNFVFQKATHRKFPH
jgi:hypothetical protein